MGMDSWLFVVPMGKARDIQGASSLDALDFEELELNYSLCYWRRHHGLHDWMETRFKEKGGVVGEYGFNGQFVRLLDDDLAKLDGDIRSGKVRDSEMLPGVNDGTVRRLIPDARDAIAAGKAVFYFGLY